MPRSAPPDRTDRIAVTSRFVTVRDGLRIHARCYEPPQAGGIPVVCLSGLARTAEDFTELALALAGDSVRPRTVVAIDYRGRGRSDYDSDPANYALPVELADLVEVIASLRCEPAIFVGTSRGGILTMLMAASHPAVLAGAVLNDIGPVIELEGLLRIKGYVGRLPPPRDYTEAATLLRHMGATQFPNLSDADWLRQARRTWAMRDGALALAYDPRLAETLAAIVPDQPLSPLWDAFDALAPIPLMVIRGAKSDILSSDTVASMQARRPDLDYLEVVDQGHAPLLVEPNVIARIAAFTAHCDATR